jgi:hypothetical protein
MSDDLPTSAISVAEPEGRGLPEEGTGGRRETSDSRGWWVPPWRVVSAKFLELRRRRGLLVAVFLLTLGVVVVLDAIFLILHATLPHSYGPAGGLQRFRGFSMAFIDTFGISAVLIGAAAGSSDISDGVFRHLVVTGRSRLALFIARVPAGLMVILPITALTYAVESVVAVFFAPTGTVTSVSLGGTTVVRGQSSSGALPHLVVQSAVPSTHVLVLTGLWLMLQVVVAFVIALGLAALTASRATTVAILIAMQLVLTPLLASVHIPHLINLQRAFVGVALLQLEPSGLSVLSGNGSQGAFLSIPAMPTFGVVIVVCAWVVAWFAIGARSMVRRDA